MAQSALQQKLAQKLAERNGGTATPSTPAPVAAAPANAPAAAATTESPKLTIAEKLAKARAAKAEPAPAEPAREEALERMASEKAATIDETAAQAFTITEKLANARATSKALSSPPPQDAARLPVDSITGSHLVGGLRDQIAMSALNGMLARGCLGEHDHLGMATSAYSYADAMLAARTA
jgi:hypothetical protein